MEMGNWVYGKVKVEVEVDKLQKGGNGESEVEGGERE